MLQSFFSLAMRKLAKHRDYAILNVLGLALSVGCCLLIFTLLRHHIGFDTYHPDADRLMRVVMDIKTETPFPFSGVPLPMADALRNECPLVETVAMRRDIGDVLVSVPNKQGGHDKYKEEGKFAWVEPSYFELLQLPLLRGSLESFKEPNTAVLAETLAKKYFGSTDPIGKVVRINNQTDLRVVGILRDLPKTTDYKEGFLGSWPTLKTNLEFAPELDSWAGASGGNYCIFRLKKGHQPEEMEAVMDSFRARHPHPDSKELFHYKVLPLLNLHFDTDYGFDVNKSYLWALAMIGIFLLVTACVNFVNMATAQALTRGREVGVRKSLGSTRGQLFWQFMAETGLIVAASLLVGFGLARLTLPYLNTWLKVDLVFDGALLAQLVPFAILLGLLLTFLAGFYPGWMQARFNPVVSLRGQNTIPVKGHFSLRKVLVTTQFFISQTLIIGAAVISAQMRFAQDADWGFRPGVVITLEVPTQGNMNALKRDLSALSGVKSVSLCYQPPASSSNNFSGVGFDGRTVPEKWLVNNKAADANYLETFNIDLIAGRNLNPADSVREFVVNETFVKRMGAASPEEALNKQMSVGQSKGPIVGVVRDYHNWSLQESIPAIAFSTFSMDYGVCAVQLRPGNPSATLDQIKAVWERLYPDHYYAVQFMDERLAEFLEDEMTLLRLINTFAGIAIFIGCLGLYGLATFMLARKRKEVGIRKSLGASVGNVLWLFGKEYAKLIAVAFLLAVPVAWWAMNNWLQDYVYRITIGLEVFAVSLLATVAIAVLTVGIQSVRAALANPVKSLRSE